LDRTVGDGHADIGTVTRRQATRDSSQPRYDERIAIADGNGLSAIGSIERHGGLQRLFPPRELSLCDANLLIAARRRGSKCQARPNIPVHADAALGHNLFLSGRFVIRLFQDL
jgi:hypothetical protein